MKKYLLVVFGDFKNEQLCKKFAKNLIPIVDSPQLKFKHPKHNAIFHFESEVHMDELYDFIIGLFYGFTDTLFLTDITDKNSVKLSDSIANDLLDLGSSSNGEEIQIHRLTEKELKDEMNEQFSEEFISVLLDEMNTEIKAPSMNEILDKISEKGIHSLTQYEKQMLDEYSKL